MEEGRGPGIGKDALVRVLMMVAHDVNNLMSGTLGYIDLAEATIDPEGRTAELLEKARRGPLSASRFNEYMLRALEARSTPFVPQRIDLKGVIETSGVKARDMAMEYELNLDIVDDVHDPELLADGFMVDLFAEIFRNSMVHSSDKKGEVSVHIRNMKGSTIIEVSDRSGGILSEKAFTAPFRLRTLMDTGNFHGSGIGLSMVQEIAERYGWAMYMENYTIEGSGSGLRVRFIIPQQWVGGRSP
jgi:signal transduction histidine kinase